MNNKQLLEGSGYGLERIAQELDQTAQGYSYYGNSLYVALDIPGVTHNEKLMLHRYLLGSEISTDRMALQDLAIKLRAAQSQEKGHDQ